VGEGVGLALVYRMVGRLGGRIWLESTAGVGSTFFVALPPAPAQPMAQAQAAKPVNALGLLWGVLVARLKSLFNRTPA